MLIRGLLPENNSMFVDIIVVSVWYVNIVFTFYGCENVLFIGGLYESDHGVDGF